MNCEGCIFLGKVFEHLANYEGTKEWRECKYLLPYFATPKAVSVEHEHRCYVREEAQPTGGILLKSGEPEALIMVALMEAIQKKGPDEWRRFCDFAWGCYYRDRKTSGSTIDFIAWLMNPPTFCEVAGEWVGKEG